MSAEPPPAGGNSGYNPNDWTNNNPNGAVDEQYLAQNYLQFPTAQGTETFGDVVVSGGLTAQGLSTFAELATFSNGINVATTAGITFSDTTVQTTAFIEANYAQLNTDNTFLTGFTQTFSGPVNLNGITNAITQLSGNNTTLVATTEFVQNAVQVSGVQVTDSPLLWSGANTNQYNAASGTNLSYSYPFGLSQLYNLSGGNEEFSLVSNNGIAGAQNNAFSIYCVQGNQTGTQLRSLFPQLTISNNNTAMFVRDGININNKNISSINTLSGNSTSAINFSSPISMNTGNAININDSSLNLWNGAGNLSTFAQNTNQLTVYNSAPASGTTNIAFNLNNSSAAPVNIIQVYINEIDFRTTLNMNSQNIIGIGALAGNGGNIVCNANFNMGSGVNMSLGNNNITQVGTLYIGDNTTANFTTLSQSGIQTNIYNNASYSAGTNNIAFAVKNSSNAQTFPLQIYPSSIKVNAGLLDLNGNSLYNASLNSNCTAQTQGAGNATAAIATTAFVQNAISTIGPVYTASSFTLTNPPSTNIVMSPSTVSTLTTYTSANNIVTFNSNTFTLTTITGGFYTLLQIKFSVQPFPNYPPASTQSSMTVFCVSNNTTYTTPVTWLTGLPASAYITYPQGAPNDAGIVFNFNLATIGGFAS